jgi:hypothetical protein
VTLTETEIIAFCAGCAAGLIPAIAHMLGVHAGVLACAPRIGTPRLWGEAEPEEPPRG